MRVYAWSRMASLAGIRTSDLLDSLWLVHGWHLAIIENA